MFYDLNVPWTSADDPELQRTVAFLDELGYNVIALNYILTGKIPNKVTCPIPKDPFPNHRNIRFLSRVTVILDDHAQNYGLPALTNIFDLVALRPTSEKLLLQACSSLEADIISLDLAVRHPYHFKQKTLGLALSRGLRFEISYGAAVASDTNARRNVISNATQLVKATKGKGLVASSGSKRAGGYRAPYDVINLATLWGLSQDKGRFCVADHPRSVVVQAELRRRAFRNVVDVVDAGGVTIVKQPQNEEAAPAVTASKKEASMDETNGATGNNKASTGEDNGIVEEVNTPMNDAPDSIQAKTPKGKRKQDEAGVVEDDTPGKSENGDDGANKKQNQGSRAKRPSKKQRVKEAKKAAAAQGRA